MSMTTALSGLIAAQQDISTTSHNIANVNTNAFRKSRAEFVDDYYTNPMDSFQTVVGSGTHMSRVAVQFDQGNFVATGQTLDLAIQGPGFFTVAPQLDVNDQPTEVAYTRNGGFKLDSNNRIADSSGRPMLAWPVANDGTVLSMEDGAMAPVDVPLVAGTTQPTDELALQMRMPSGDDMLGQQDAVPPTNAFDAADPTSYAFSTPVPMSDEQGNAVEARAYYIKTRNPDVADETTEYEMRLFVDGNEVPAADALNPTTFTFDVAGELVDTQGDLEFGVGAVDYTVSVAGSMMQDQPFAMESANHNGTGPMGLSNLEVDDSGIIWANYGTDNRMALGRVALATFPNPQGLRQTGNASFRAAADSGQPVHSAPGEKGLGQLQSGMLERSNVDLTEELVHLLTAQRNYQANAKAMETSSSLMQSVMNIRS